MNDLQIFNNPEFGEIRTIEIDGEPWFVGRDIAVALGYAKPWNAIDSHVDKDDTLKQGIVDSRGQNQQTTIINESGLYSLIIMSELPSAKKFKRWITKDVIPSIAKTGFYSLPQLSKNELLLQIAQANVELEKRVEKIEQDAEESRTKLETAMQIFSNTNIVQWKIDINNTLEQLSKEHSLNLTTLRGILYKELEANGVSLQSRVSRMQNRLKKQGATYRERHAVTKIDVISQDKKLRLIFEEIVKKYQTLYTTSK